MNGLLIGRFQPFHLGHLEALQFALSKVDKLWIGLGSSNKSIQKNNPFSAEERQKMILSSIDDSMKERILIYPIPDLDNHIKWIEKIDSIVPKFDIVFSKYLSFGQRTITGIPSSINARGPCFISPAG